MWPVDCRFLANWPLAASTPSRKVDRERVPSAFKGGVLKQSDVELKKAKAEIERLNALMSVMTEKREASGSVRKVARGNSLVAEVVLDAFED